LGTLTFPMAASQTRSTLAERALLAAVAIAALWLPTSARAEVPQIASFTASPATVKVGHTTVVSAAVQPLNPAYHVAIVNTDTGQTVMRCAATFSPCYSQVKVPWSENASPDDLHFEAEVVPKEAPETGSGVPLTVDVERFEWSVSLKASKNPLTVGESTTLSVGGLEPSPAYTGYHTKIFNDRTGQEIVTCWGHQCAPSVSFGYAMQPDAGPVDVHAEVVSETAPYDVAGRADLTLYVDPIRFGVGMAFSAPQTDWKGERSWLATITAAPRLSGTPFYVSIENSGGGEVSGCSLWSSCALRLGPGTYRAAVRDTENLYAATQWWTIPSSPTAEPEEETADDFNLLALATMFAGPSQVCGALLFYPGTHFQGSSVSDQYLACEQAVAAGKSTSAVLRAVAAAGGGTAVLWYLYETQTEQQTAPEQTEPTEESLPPPVTPIGWPGEIATETGTLRTLNPQLTSDREARIVIKQCHRLTIRANLPTSRCLELPIFASGDLDVPQATKHDLEALLYYPPWVKLNYERSKGKAGEGWYKAFAVCKENSPFRHCDEFPFFSTLQGGGSARPRPSLKLIDATHNQRQGGKLGRFYNACGVNVGEGRPFLNVPMPPGSNIPTLLLCNGNS
jgi:Deoxyribonuclease NucA/NucB